MLLEPHSGQTLKFAHTRYRRDRTCIDVRIATAGRGQRTNTNLDANLRLITSTLASQPDTIFSICNASFSYDRQPDIWAHEFGESSERGARMSRILAA